MASYSRDVGNGPFPPGCMKYTLLWFLEIWNTDSIKKHKNSIFMISLVNSDGWESFTASGLWIYWPVGLGAAGTTQTTLSGDYGWNPACELKCDTMWGSTKRGVWRGFWPCCWACEFLCVWRPRGRWRWSLMGFSGCRSLMPLETITRWGLKTTFILNFRLGWMCFPSHNVRKRL